MMPIYDARCESCGTDWNYVAPVSMCYAVPACPKCGGPGRKIILSAPQGFVTGKFEQFRSPVDGTLVRTQKDLKDHNARNGVTNIHDGYSESALKEMATRKKEPLKADKKDIAKDVLESIHKVESGYKPVVETADD